MHLLYMCTHTHKTYINTHKTELSPRAWSPALKLSQPHKQPDGSGETLGNCCKEGNQFLSNLAKCTKSLKRSLYPLTQKFHTSEIYLKKISRNSQQNSHTSMFTTGALGGLSRLSV